MGPIIYLIPIMCPHTDDVWIGSMPAVKEDIECIVNFLSRNYLGNLESGGLHALKTM